MKRKANPRMVILARESRGYSQKELADKINVTQGTISKIENSQFVSDELIDKIAIALEYRSEFFYKPADMFPPGINFYRKHKTLPKRDLDRIAAEVDIRRIHIEDLLQSADIIRTNIIELDKDIYESPEEAAQLIRENWKIPSGRIDDLVYQIEKAGIIVVYCNVTSYQFSAVSKYTSDLQYIIFVNENQSPDRIRFTLAHELGHIVMHTIPSPQNEDEADAFAAEFLMPEKDIAQNLSSLNLQKLASLKRHWRVSMASLIKRATNLGTITDRQARYLWMKMAKLGYTRREPAELDPPKETPALLSDLITLHTNNLAYTDEQLSSMLGLTADECARLYTPHSSKNARYGKKHLTVVE